MFSISSSSPLEQFELYYFIALGLFMLLLLLRFLDSLEDSDSSNNLVLVDTSEFDEPVFEASEGIFISQMTDMNIGFEGSFGDFLYFTFFFFAILNLVGLLPGVSTLNAHLQFTFPWALGSFLLVVVCGIYRYGSEYLAIFFPSGVPFFLSFLLVPIEFISYAARPISLGVRMFANMLAGHALIVILLALFILLLTPISASVLLLFSPFFLVLLGVFVLEYAVSLLQSYVFTTLLGTYYRELGSSH